MVFLIEYNRSQGALVNILAYDDSRREQAQRDRLEIELDLSRRKTGHEIVMLEAESEQALRRTHRRYFESLDELAATPS